MRDLARDNGTSTTIMQLPDDCLTIIFHGLDHCNDRASFGLTCLRWLYIHDFNRRTLQFLCSFTILCPSLTSRTCVEIQNVQLHSLLRRFQHLESLSLSGCSALNDAALTQLQICGSNLQKLNLSCCFKLTDYALSLVASGCPSLVSISLYRCIRITDSGLENIASACSALKCVNLSYCSQVSDKGLKALTLGCRQLKAIDISHCEGITGVGFKGCSKTLACVVAASCKLNPEGVIGIISGGGVEYLDVSSLSWSPFGDPLAGIGLSASLKILNFRLCRTLSSKSIVEIAKGCPLLEEWNLALCHEVKVSGWQAIGLYCQNLKTLHVNRCRNLSDDGLMALRDGCRSLSTLYLNGCVLLTPLAIELFKSHRANVSIKEIEVMCMKPNWEFIRFLWM